MFFLQEYISYDYKAIRLYYQESDICFYINETSMLVNVVLFSAHQTTICRNKCAVLLQYGKAQTHAQAGWVATQPKEKCNLVSINFTNLSPSILQVCSLCSRDSSMQSFSNTVLAPCCFLFMPKIIRLDWPNQFSCQTVSNQQKIIHKFTTVLETATISLDHRGVRGESGDSR